MKTPHNWRSHLEEIFLSALRSVDPEILVKENIEIEGEILIVGRSGSQKSYDLSFYQKIYVLGYGKGAAKMALAIEEVLKGKIDKGVIVVKYGHLEELKKIKILEAGHPLPDGSGIQATHEIKKMAREADEKTLVINLISGGGSSLTPSPIQVTIKGKKLKLSLEDKQKVTDQLLKCGASIDEINCIRKHLSAFKGGRLAELIYPATSISLLLSDVKGDLLDVIASGPTYWDRSTFSEMSQILEKYALKEGLPEKILKILDCGLNSEIEETPGSDHVAFSKTDHFLIGTNQVCLKAAFKKAHQLGFITSIITSQLHGEAKEVAKVLHSIAMEAKQRKLHDSQPVCFLFGGETTVTLSGTGKGGRNQEMALAFLQEINVAPEGSQGIYFLAASTDGTDGPTDAAGAFATEELLKLARDQSLSISRYLTNHDSYSFFEPLGNLFKIGPTNTNVCDVQIILIF